MNNILNKISIVILLAVVLASCKQRDGFIIHGTISGDFADVDSIMINRESMVEEKAIYAVPVIDGKFTIEGKVDAIERVNIGNTKAEVGNYLVLENDEYHVDISSELFTVTGGKVQEEVFGFYNSKEYDDLMKRYLKVVAAMDDIDEEDEEESQEEMYQLNVQVDEIMAKASKIEDDNYNKVFNDKNSSTLAKMLVVTNSQNYRDFPVKKRRELLAEYKKELGEHRNLTNFIQFLDQEDMKEQMGKTVTAGNPYKPVKGLDVNGKEIDLADVIKDNKYTLLEFWASWCGPCRAEVPHLKEAYEKFKGKGFEIYSFSIDDSKKGWEQALKEDQPNWSTHVLKQGNAGEKILNSYGISGIPASFLIDQKGTIVASNEELRGDALKETLRELLKK